MASGYNGGLADGEGWTGVHASVAVCLSVRPSVGRSVCLCLCVGVRADVGVGAGAGAGVGAGACPSSYVAFIVTRASAIFGSVYRARDDSSECSLGT